jgi:RNA polymerase sigma-70 factor (ECF subfamily)
MDGLINNEQFLVLLTSHQRRLMGYIRALVPNKADAEEVLQEVNLHVCRHADEFQPDTNFAAWALRIAHFCVLTWRERRSRDRLVFDDSMLERLAVAAGSFEMRDDRRQHALEECLEKLAPQERELVTQFYGEQDASPQSLAQRIGRSLKGLYVSVHRIRAKLFGCIERALAAEDRA